MTGLRDGGSMKREGPPRRSRARRIGWRAALLGAFCAAASAAAVAREATEIVAEPALAPLVEAVADELSAPDAPRRAAVTALPDGAAYRAFCAGVGREHPDFIFSTRGPKQSEIALCRANGVPLQPLTGRTAARLTEFGGSGVFVYAKTAHFPVIPEMRAFETALEGALRDFTRSRGALASLATRLTLAQRRESVLLSALSACEGETGLGLLGLEWRGRDGAEPGDHLRWAYDPSLGYPSGGFDLYQETTVNLGRSPFWRKVNREGPIAPARHWSEPARRAQRRRARRFWRPYGQDRAPASSHWRFEGDNAEAFVSLRKHVALPPDAKRYFVEGQDDPFETAAEARSYAAGVTPTPAVLGPLKPGELLLTMSAHVEIARLLGLAAFLEEDADLDPVLTDRYIVVGHWEDGLRCAATTLVDAAARPLRPTSPLRAELLPGPVHRMADGAVSPIRAMVGLAWDPPTASPADAFRPEDQIPPTLFRIEVADAAGGWTPLRTRDPSGAIADADPVLPGLLSRRPGDDGASRWARFFAFDRAPELGLRRYRLIGIDMFGRESAPSREASLTVEDVYAPAAPSLVQATLFQREDPAISGDGRPTQPQTPPALRDRLFPPGSAHQVALKVEWLWPRADADRDPDLSDFQILHQFDDPAAFSDAGPGAPWRQTANWSGALGVVAAAAGSETPAALLGDRESLAPLLDGARRYETIITDARAAALAAMRADDDRPIVNGYVTVIARDVRGNASPPAPPAVVTARDFTPPAPPKAPVLARPGGAADRRGYVSFDIRAPDADRRYTYQFARVSADRLAGASASSASPPGCAADPNAERALDQARAAANPDLYGMRSAVPARPSDGPDRRPQAVFTDKVDGARSHVLYFAAYAIDRAGNRSDPSCPSLAIDIRDAIAPRAPIFTNVAAVEGGVALDWAVNREADLQRYALYRSDEKSRTNNAARMRMLATFDPAGRLLERGPGAIEPSDAETVIRRGDRRMRWIDRSATPGRPYYYRMIAQDRAGNSSALSQIAAGRAIDLTPPAAPTWEAGSAIVTDAAGERSADLRWSDAEPGLRHLLQRRAEGSALWRTIAGWTRLGGAYLDAGLRPKGRYRYRLRAMDPTGNRGPWSPELTLPAP